MDTMKFLILVLAVIATFALCTAEEGSLGNVLQPASVSGGVTAGFFNRQKRQYFGQGPGYGGFGGGSFSNANANAQSFGGGGFGGGFSGSSANAQAGSSNFGGFGRKK